jgi:hypothetical protein
MYKWTEGNNDKVIQQLSETNWRNITVANQQQIWIIITFKLTSESKTTGHLPPSSKVTGVRCLAAAAITTLPTFALPEILKTKDTLIMFISVLKNCG